MKSVLKHCRWMIALALLTESLSAKPQLTFYCGITMVPAMQSLIKTFEQDHNCTVQIEQGGSGELLRSLQLYRKGDLFLPGSESYYRKAPRRLFPYRRAIGHNRLAIFIRSDEAPQIRSLEDLHKREVYFAIGDPEIGSVGRATRALIRSKGSAQEWKRFQDEAVYFGSDSRDLLRLMLEQGVAATVN